MDFDLVVKTINELLIEKRPDTFNSSWIQKHAPHVYRFIRKNVRTEMGGIDWDRVTRCLDRKLQRKWITSARSVEKKYRKKTEVEIIIQKYHGKLYTFLNPSDKGDNDIRDRISIALVRTAQKGNILAREEIIKLIRFTVDDWVERHPKISVWQGYESLIQKRIEGCIRCYRYSGSFIGYVYKTLEYAGRGLRSITASLNDSLYSKKHLG